MSVYGECKDKGGPCQEILCVEVVDEGECVVDRGGLGEVEVDKDIKPVQEVQQLRIGVEVP
eukprot:514173-Karenia_brevis.AAC.1